MYELPSKVHEVLGHEGDGEKQATRVNVLTVLLTVAVILLALPHLKTAYYGVPVHYIGRHGPGVAEPGVVDNDMALDFAQRWIEMRHTYTPETYKKKVAKLTKWLHPKIRLKFKKQTEDEFREISKKEQSSQAVIAEDGMQITRRKGNLIFLELVGIRTVFIGGVPRPENMRTDMAVMPYFADGHAGELVVMQESTNFGEAKR